MRCASPVLFYPPTTANRRVPFSAGGVTLVTGIVTLLVGGVIFALKVCYWHVCSCPSWRGPQWT